MASAPNLDDLALSSSRLLDKADALIARNRGDGINAEVEELPVLLDQIFTPSKPAATPAVELAPPMDPIAIAEPPAALPPAPAVDPGLDPQYVTEKLIELDAYISQTLNNWISDELPGIIQSEVGSMIDRIRNQTLAHMRATLLAEISDKLISVLDETLKKK